MRILFISPHPDDVEIGCGASVVKWSTDTTVSMDLLVVAGEGDLTMVSSGKTIPFSQRKEEQQKAADVMGIPVVMWADYAPAGKFDTVGLGKLVGILDRLLPGYDKVFIPLPSYNQDHKVVWDACMAATRPGKVDALEIYAYEQPMQGHGEQVFGVIAGRAYNPVTERQVIRKVNAIERHHSQTEGRPNSIVGASGVSALARFRGVEIGVELAEMFYPIRTRL